MMNGLRDRIVVQVDGQMKTGRDVVVGALLGAEEFGFATAPLVVSGCIMMRVCHLDTCPVGIATQNPELRKRFNGQPEFVATFFEYIAEEVREHLAALGLRSIDEAVGRADLLDAGRGRRPLEGGRPRPERRILAVPDSPYPTDRRCTRFQDHGLEKALDHQFLAGVPAGHRGRHAGGHGPAHHQRRPHGGHAARLGDHPAPRGGAGLPDGTITLTFTGSAGQSFGAFVPRGVTMRLFGDANDYFGKGLSGGRLVLRPPEDSPFVAEEQIIAGNVILYGATGRRGLHPGPGRRALLRPQLGGHGRGRGRGRPRLRVHDRRPGGRPRTDRAQLRGRHVRRRWPTSTTPSAPSASASTPSWSTWSRSTPTTSSGWPTSWAATWPRPARRWPARLLADWATTVEDMVKVMPRDYRRVLEATRRATDEGRSVDEAVMAAAHG